MMMLTLLAAVLFETSQNGVSLKLESDVRAIDPGRSVFLKMEVVYDSDRTVRLPDLRDRVEGFLQAEDFVEEIKKNSSGKNVQTVNWRLIPEPCADVYKIRPFLVTVSPQLMSSRADEGKYSFIGGPVYFENPPPREPVTGGMEIDPKKDLPPLSWKLVGWIALALVVVVGVALGIWLFVRYCVRRVKEHRMSPIERAWVELDRLIKKGLPGRGRYKDFYVELTMVVRRYIQRKYGIKAPHLTTEEFLREAHPSDELKRFLESADMVKFAGVEATPEMADEATDSARAYLKRDTMETEK